VVGDVAHRLEGVEQAVVGPAGELLPEDLDAGGQAADPATLERVEVVHEVEALEAPVEDLEAGPSPGDRRRDVAELVVVERVVGAVVVGVVGGLGDAGARRVEVVELAHAAVSLDSDPVLLVGLTGGIGSGKSTVSALLAARGAVVVDADAITRSLQQPGQPVFDAMVERFGPGIVGADGQLDRPAVAAIVFSDDAAKKDLEAIVHPAVGAEMLRRLQEHSGTDSVVIYDVPLLVESGKTGYGAVVVVDVDPEVAVQRLVAHRGFVEADARARIANQVSREERLAVADRVVDNSGTLADLEAQVDELWTWLVERQADAGVAEASHPS
jgi:dephospho-CoA kinase